MKSNFLKIIFIALIIILFIIAIYVNIFYKDDNTKNITGQYQTNKKNTIISNNIRIGIIEFDNINPILSNNKNVQDISRLIFDPLFTLTQDYKLKECLATECSKIEEQTYIIKLRENVKWHDGTVFDASDVIFTIDMIKKKENNSIYYYNVENISSVEKIDEYTLKITLNENVQYFQYNLIFPIISSKYFDEKNITTESKNIKPVGTGLFYISDVQNNSILLKKNITSWNNQVIQLDTITLNLYNSLTSTISAFEIGDLDLFTTSNINIEEYLKNIKYNKVEYLNRKYDYIVLNCKSNILSNLEVRQAINSAIDKDEIIKDIYNTKYKRSNFPLDFGSYVYDNKSVAAYDKNTSKSLLVNARWKYSSKKWRKTVKYKYLKIELDLIINKEDRDKVKVANKIKEQLEEVGIVINVIETDKSKYNTYLKNKKYDMLIQSNTYAYSPNLNKYFKNDNLANYTNKEVEERINKVENINNESELKKIYNDIVDIYNEEVPYISLYFNTNTIVYSNNLKGNINPNSYNLFYGIESWYREYIEK